VSRASDFRPSKLRTVDDVHRAATELASELDVFLTYDIRDAARSLGFPVAVS